MQNYSVKYKKPEQQGPEISISLIKQDGESLLTLSGKEVEGHFDPQPKTSYCNVF